MDISTIKKELNRNIIFKSLISPTVPLLDALIFSSGNYLPKSKIKEGNCKVYGGGGDTKLTHNQYNIESETIAIGRVGARCGCVFKVESNSWVTDNALYIKQKTYEYNNDFLVEYLTFLNLNRFANTAAQPVISLKRISNCLIPVLSINKQEEILNRINNDNNSKFHVMIDNSANLISEFKNQLEIISKLRQAFLREAMQGKLVSNKTSDGKTGADLLAEIQAEKAQLIKEKKIKKSKPFPPISEGEIPFDIPENWAWCRLGEVIKHTDNLDIQKHFSEDVLINYVDIEAIDNKSNRIREVKQKIVSELSSRARRVLHKDYILYSTVRPYLKNIAIIEENLDNYIGSTGFLVFKPIKILKEFVFYFLLNPDLNKYFETLMVGFNSPSISNETFEKTLIPLPTIKTQKQIVLKLNELMQYCDNLENSVKESQQYNEMLLQQVLREALEGKEESKPQLKVNKTCDNNDTAILASYIIQELNTPDFGRTKLQKILHLAEYHCRLETPLQYYKKTAGPYSKNLENDIENLLRRNKLYDSKKEELKNSDKSKVNYIPLSGAKQINSFFTTEFKDQKEDIDNLLKKFNDKPMEFCEMISTMYAVWNNRLIKGETIDNEELKKDFLAWDAQKIKFLDKLDYSIEWIKKEGLEPSGFGKYIDKQ
ncbi:restriction endonuclease subunit S [uncultured Chryseobacterium sp.]|uniref:restriction endonuclease subunit S n=1 Tax=uncultured Chryseobacterium sp. TaxID=259322 RepID=UPI00258A9AFC|nr:restriction endonuclease subunit S [uncultured Chryseobacterium sp.]